MKVLLDECLPKTLKQEFKGYDVSTVPEMGWAGKTNGELLRLAAGKFDTFVTIDQNLQYQQNLRQAALGVILVGVKNNRYETIKPLMSSVKQVLQTIRKGQLIKVPK